MYYLSFNFDSVFDPKTLITGPFDDILAYRHKYLYFSIKRIMGFLELPWRGDSNEWQPDIFYALMWKKNQTNTK